MAVRAEISILLSNLGFGSISIIYEKNEDFIIIANDNFDDSLFLVLYDKEKTRLIEGKRSLRSWFIAAVYDSATTFVGTETCFPSFTFVT